MQSVLRVKTTVQPGRKIEIMTPEFTEGQEIEVLLMPSEEADISKPSAIDIIRGLQGHHLFESADEVDRFLQQERDAWGS